VYADRGARVNVLRGVGGFFTKNPPRKEKKSPKKREEWGIFYKKSPEKDMKWIVCWVCCVFSVGVAAEVMPVVASFSIVADLARQVGGRHVRVDTLAGADVDMHVYQPTPTDMRRIYQAKVLVVNGLGFEGWLDAWSKRRQGRGPLVVVASQGIKAIEATHEGCADGGGHTHDHHHEHAVDPHAWHNIVNVMRYVDNIATGFSRADPVHADEYQKNAAAYKRQLQDLDTALMKQFSAIAAQKRRVITSHNAFQYFGQRYGLVFIGLQGVNAASEPSAAAIAATIQEIRRLGVRALFIENVSNPRLLTQISRQTGVRVGGRLYSDALSAENGVAPTYLKMMQYNAQQLIRALRTDLTP